MHILSMQSWVATGHAGNAAAIFPLQRLGAEVSAIHTVQFSNHTGHGAWTGEAYSAAAIAALVDGIAARGVLAGCDALLAGYAGRAEMAETFLDTANRLRAANPRAWFCCDPVIGDSGRGRYVAEEIVDLLCRRVVPQADILTPNGYELAQLTGHEVATLGQARRAMDRLRARMRPHGPRVVLVTSLSLADTPPDQLWMLASDGAGTWRLALPRLPIAPAGAGDATAAMFLFHLLRGASAGLAMEWAGSAMHAILRRTLADEAAELALVAAQEMIVAPTPWIAAERLG